MKITIDRVYTHLKNLSYAPEADVTSGTVPINEFEAEIYAYADDLSPGIAASLRDDLDQLWAQFRLAEIKRLDERTLRVLAQSLIAALEGRQMAGVMYELTPLADVLTAIFQSSASYTLAAALQNKTVSGLAPEQSARDRLQWVLTAVGAYVQQTNASLPTIQPTPAPDEIALSIPVSDVYWRPDVETTERTESVCATAYTYMLLDDWTADDKAQLGDETYLVLKRRFWLASAAEIAFLSTQNPVAKGVTLLSPDNVASVLAAQYPYVFSARTVEADVINNDSYIPGDIVSVPTTAGGDRITGVVDSASFAFGLQAKSTLKVRELWSDGAAHTVHTLTVTHDFPGDDTRSAATLQTEYFRVPAGLNFAFETAFYYDASYVMRPTTPLFARLDMPDSDTSASVGYALALDNSGGGLTIKSVSTLEPFAFAVNSSWSYRKNIVLQLDGVDVVKQNVVSFTLKQAQDSPHSRKVSWWPKDYVDTIAPVMYQQDLVLREGTVNCVFRTVELIKIPLYGGGMSEWVAIEEVPNV